MSLKLVRNKLGRGHKLIYVPDLSRIIEESSNVTTEEPASESESDSGYAVSECGWFEDEFDEFDELEHTVLNNKADYDIYSALVNTTTMLRQSGCKEFKLYQAAFAQYLIDYSTYSNNAGSFLEKITAIYSTHNNESESCCSFFKKKPPVNTVTNNLVISIIHSNLKIDLESIQRIQELAQANLPMLTEVSIR